MRIRDSRRRRASYLLAAALLLAGSGIHAQVPARGAATGGLKALVGGTLIDGYGGAPIRNSVILIQGERITRVGTVGSLPIPAGAEVISTEGHRCLRRSVVNTPNRSGGSKR